MALGMSTTQMGPRWDRLTLPQVSQPTSISDYRLLPPAFISPHTTLHSASYVQKLLVKNLESLSRVSRKVNWEEEKVVKFREALERKILKVMRRELLSRSDVHNLVKVIINSWTTNPGRLTSRTADCWFFLLIFSTSFCCLLSFCRMSGFWRKISRLGSSWSLRSNSLAGTKMNIDS
jgi:hypothetical protein